jgi:hypothetical protein
MLIGIKRIGYADNRASGAQPSAQLDWREIQRSPDFRYLRFTAAQATR